MADIRRALEAPTPCVEYRLDYAERVDEQMMQALREAVEKKVAIFTVRRREEGGAWRGTEEERIRLYASLLDLRPHYIDVEAESPAARELAPSGGTKVIASRHDFEQTPPLEVLMQWGRKAAEVGDVVKIATYARSPADGLRVLSLIGALEKPTVAFAMELFLLDAPGQYAAEVVALYNEAVKTYGAQIDLIAYMRRRARAASLALVALAAAGALALLAYFNASQWAANATLAPISKNLNQSLYPLAKAWYQYSGPYNVTYYYVKFKPGWPETYTVGIFAARDAGWQTRLEVVGRSGNPGGTYTISLGNVQQIGNTQNAGSYAPAPAPLVWSMATTGRYSILATAQFNKGGIYAVQLVNFTAEPMLVEKNLIVRVWDRKPYLWVDQPPPEKDPELGIGKHYAWQTPLHREAVKKALEVA